MTTKRLSSPKKLFKNIVSSIHQAFIRIRVFKPLEKKIVVFFSFFIIFILIVFVFNQANVWISQKKGQDFSKNIEKCNSEFKTDKFSCYRSTIEKFYKDDLDGFFRYVEGKNDLTFSSTDKSYAIFGTSCHTFYHAAGDYIASETKGLPLSSAISYCPRTCTSGCIMGLYKRKGLEASYSTDSLKDFFNLCRQGEGHQCAHEIGHLLHDKYTYSILKVIDDISAKKYNFKPNEEYHYVTFQKPDLNTPFEECKQIVSEKELPYCFTGVGHNLFLFAEFSPDGYKSQFDECNKVADSNKDNCYAFLLFRIGINEAAPRFIVKEYQDGNQICNQAVNLVQRPDLKYHCYMGLGGGIGLFADSEYPSSKLVLENDLEGIKKELISFAAMCQQAEKELIDKCYAGLLGTRYKELYKKLELRDLEIERILPTIEGEGFQVVG